MPLSIIQLDQTEHIGGSGTLVSDEELIDASGFLQAQIPDVLNDLDDVTIISPASDEFLQFDGTKWINTSGVTEGDVTNIANNTFTSGILAAENTLPALGHYNNATEVVINNNFAAVLFKKSASDKFISWNTFSPINASGVRLRFLWSPKTTQTGVVAWELDVTPLPISGDLGNLTSNIATEFTPDQTYIADIIQEEIISVSGIPIDQSLQLIIKRDGANVADTLNAEAHFFDCAMSFF